MLDYLEPFANRRQLAATSSFVNILSFIVNNQVPQSGDAEFFNHIWFL
jgi:hypothetical protein